MSLILSLNSPKNPTQAFTLAFLAMEPRTPFNSVQALPEMFCGYNYLQYCLLDGLRSMWKETFCL